MGELVNRNDKEEDKLNCGNSEWMLVRVSLGLGKHELILKEPRKSPES